MQEEYDIKVKPEIEPVIHPPRRVPFAIKEKFKKKSGINVFRQNNSSSRSTN